MPVILTINTIDDDGTSSVETSRYDGVMAFETKNPEYKNIGKPIDYCGTVEFNDYTTDMIHTVVIHYRNN